MTERTKRHEAWFSKALEGELQAIEQLPIGLNIKKPNNPFWQSLFKIAGLVNAGYLSQEIALEKIKHASTHMQLREKDIGYQWKRACQRAGPRSLQD